MKIQLSNHKVVPDMLCVYQAPEPGVDLTMDMRKLTFAPGSLEAIFSFHILDSIFPEEIVATLRNWRECLNRDKATLFLVVDNFEYIARGFVGGDMTVEDFNAEFTHPVHFTQDSLLGMLVEAGFNADSIRIWTGEIPNLYDPKPFELILSADTA